MSGSVQIRNDQLVANLTPDFVRRGDPNSGGTGLFLNIVTKTANYVVTLQDFNILVDATSGNLTITLPTAVSALKFIFNIMKIDSTVNTVTIDGDGAETINGATTQVITAQWDSISIQSNGTAWYIW